jgi:uncharacterized protein YndB with AHSA1/START domain
MRWRPASNAGSDSGEGGPGGGRQAGAARYVTGHYLELERPRRLRFTWSCSAWADPSVQSLVTVTLEEHGGDETMMTIEHEQLPPEEVDSHRHGWGTIAVQLGGALREDPV